jgi:aryl-alcohol dehydrogenase-like predicted oxidoreductase
MKRRSRERAEQHPPAEASRRRFLTGIVAGAALGACGEAAHKMTGGPMGAGDMPDDPELRPDARVFSRDARASTSAPPDAAGAPSPDAAGAPPGPQADAGAPDPGPVKKAASDQVILGATGIKVSRLAMGSGTHGSGGTSEQTRLGVNGFARLLVQSYHEQGLNFWETADGYGSHPHLKEAIRQVGRDKVVVLTKSKARTAAQMQADVERFLTELGTDHIDVILLHAIERGTWTRDLAGAMEYLADAKRRGIIRAHGISCHSLPALRLAAKTPWVDVDLARINPNRIEMDADPATVISVLREMKAAGKGVVGMKILGVGRLASQMDNAIRHAVQLDAIDAFTIGFTSTAQLQQITTKITQVQTM